jgi:hypothetical protein
MNRFNAFLMRKFYLFVLILFTVQVLHGSSLVFAGMAHEQGIFGQSESPFPIGDFVFFMILSACIFYLLLLRRSADIKEGRYKV